MIMATVQHSLEGSILSYTHSSRWSLCQTAQCLDWEEATQFLLLQTLAKDLKLDCEEIHIVLYALQLWLSITQPFENTVSRQTFCLKTRRETRGGGAFKTPGEPSTLSERSNGTLKRVSIRGYGIDCPYHAPPNDDYFLTAGSL